MLPFKRGDRLVFVPNQEQLHKMTVDIVQGWLKVSVVVHLTKHNYSDTQKGSEYCWRLGEQRIGIIITWMRYSGDRDENYYCSSSVKYHGSLSTEQTAVAHQKTVENVGGWVKNVLVYTLEEVQW